ncbi:sigma 54-interacting transcriptional regulator [Haliangium sp.]|uniref:sigma 54-interacting transcriptional regulator n=1 Tax=Haliangium sp. TaxID=2663208 RepID=UPI003D0BC927
MKADDLHILELLDPAPETGSIKFKNRRMLLWDADAFGHLRRELIECLGMLQARSVLKRFGFANGYRDALTTGELFRWDDDREWWLSCPALQSREGKVLPRPQHLVVDRDRGVFEVEVVWRHSYEAEQHRRVFGQVDAPVCWTLAGYASGFSSALMGEEVYAVETECMAMGGATCRVVGKTRRAWGAAGDAHAEDYQARNLTEQLEAREAELRRHEHSLRRRERALVEREASLGSRGGIVAKSRHMENVLDLAETVARVDTTVLVRGESGVGKELLARYVHDQSPRRDGPFIAVNCGALPENLLESELFGHVKGSFTGADRDKQGLFEAAAGGTIFLDEVGEMSLPIQVKLLRVLQERKVRTVGAPRERQVDVRVLAATNRSLEQMVPNGSFRKDLYYRLNVVSVEIPPLRDRREDILPLARDFLAKACAAYGMQARTLSAEAVDALSRYHWPGNVRELENAIERAVVMSGEGSKIQASELPPEVRGAGNGNGKVIFGEIVPMADIEKRYVLQVLDRFDGNRTHTAKALGIGANTLWRKLKSWGVPPARDPRSS